MQIDSSKLRVHSNGERRAFTWKGRTWVNICLSDAGGSPNGKCTDVGRPILNGTTIEGQGIRWARSDKRFLSVGVLSTCDNIDPPRWWPEMNERQEIESWSNTKQVRFSQIFNRVAQTAIKHVALNKREGRIKLNNRNRNKIYNYSRTR